MVKKNFRFALSVVSLISVIFAMTALVTGAPVRFSQVTQIVNVKPGKANAANYTRLYLPGNVIGDDDDDDKKSKPVKQDDRVITETSVEIIEAEDCNCTQIRTAGGVSPYFALLGLGALPIFFIADNDPTPTPPMTPTPTPPGSPTPTPPMMTPTPTPPGSPTPTPPMTPMPTPPTEPVPEPITLLLFGTGLAGIGLAARRRLGGRGEENED